jgi:hypothetical protein
MRQQFDRFQIDYARIRMPWFAGTISHPVQSHEIARQILAEKRRFSSVLK